MNEKDKKSLIIISSVFVFVLVFMVFFTFYRRDAMLSDRTVPKINTEVDPPILADECLEYSSWSAPSCVKTSSNNFGTPSCSTGDQSASFYCKAVITGSNSSGPIYDTYNCTRERSCISWSCSSGSYATSNGCRTCQEPYTSSAGGTGGADSCYINVPAGQQFADGHLSKCPEGKYAPSTRKAYYGTTEVRCLTCDGTVTGDGTGCDLSTPTPTPATKTCYKFSNNTCTEETVTGTTCNSANNYYSSWADCREHISCGTNEYIYGNNCMSCGANKTLKYTGCQGNAESCCEAVSTPTPTTSLCTAGYYLDGIECKECPEGYACPGGDKKPTLCSTGAVCENGIQYSCPAGTYNNKTGQKSRDACLPCDGESEYSGKAAISCSVCDGPATSDHTGCVYSPSSGCSVGWFRGQNGCEKCPAGSYCPDGIRKLQCYGNRVSLDEGNSSCTSFCSGELVPNSTHTGCKKCSAGSVPNYDNSMCAVCSRGSYQSGTSCLMCPAGSYCSSGTTISTIKDCPIGYYCPRESYYPKSCNPGYATEIAKATSENDCVKQNDKPIKYCYTIKRDSEGFDACIRVVTAVDSCPEEDYYFEEISKCAEHLDCYSDEYLSDAKCTYCPNGYLCDGSAQLYPCPEGYYCEYGDKYPVSEQTPKVKPNVSCPAGQGADSSATTGCSSCAKGYYSTAGDSECHACGTGSHSNSDKSGCVCDDGYKSIGGVCTKLQDFPEKCCITNSSGKKSTIDSQSGCQQAAIAGQTIVSGACPAENVCPAGQGADPSATTGCSNCAKGYWSDDNGSQCYKCQEGYSTSHSGATSALECIKVEDIGKTCAISSITTSSGTTSMTSNGTIDPNSYYVVLVTVSGECNNETLEFSATNGTASPSSIRASYGNTSYSFRVYPTSCDESIANAKVVSNGNNRSISKLIDIKTDWKKVESNGCYDIGARPVGFFAADAGNYDEYYDNWGSCGDGRNGYREKWERYGCNLNHGSGSPSTPNPDNPETPEKRYCYVKRGNGTDNTYCDNTESVCTNAGYTIKVTSGSCGESSACYLRRSDNTFVTGKFSGQSGYTYYGTTCPETKCYIKKTNSGNEYKESTSNPGSGWSVHSGECFEDKACYKKSDNSFVYGMFNGQSGYTKVDISNCGSVKCYVKVLDSGNEYLEASTKPDNSWEEYDGVCSEEPACYLKITDDSYVTGRYKNNSNYKYYGKKCPTPGCYVSSDGIFEWGDFLNDSNYTLVFNITDKENCGVTPDVPQTDMNVQTIIYIAVACMSVAGIYFVVRYNNKSKKI